MFGLDNLDDAALGALSCPEGIPVVQPQVIQARLTKEIAALKHEMGLRESDFNNYIVPVLIRFIEYADLLPASQFHHHWTGGGLISHSFDVAKRAVRAAQHTQFPIGVGTFADTQQSNDQWRAGSVIAAFLHDGGKILADMVVSNGAVDEDRIVWDSHGQESVYMWARRNKIDRYFISWNRQRHMKHQNASLMVMQRIVPQETWSWIDSCYDGKLIHSAMLAAIAKSSLDHPTSRIVAECDSASVNADMFTKNSPVTKEVTQLALSELLTVIMKHYILTETWTINKKNALVWFVDSKIYVVWDNAVADLIEKMNSGGFAVPEVPEVLAAIMIEDGLAIAGKDGVYSDVYPEILGEPKKPVKIRALRLRHVESIIYDPSKLYSIKEHGKRPIEKVEVGSSEVISTDIDDSDIWDTEDNEVGNIRKQKMFESVAETVDRVLGLMTEARKKKLQEETVIFEQSDPEPVVSKEPKVSEVTNSQSEVLTCNIAKFIAANFDSTIKNGKVMVSGDDAYQIEQGLIDANVAGVNEFSALKMMKSSNEVVFI